MLRSNITRRPHDVTMKLNSCKFIYASDALPKEEVIEQFKSTGRLHLGFDDAQIDGIVNNYHYKNHLNLIYDYSEALLTRKYSHLKIIALLENSYREKTGDLLIDLLKEKLILLGFNTEQVNELSVTHSRANELMFIYNASVALLKRNYTCEDLFLIARCFLGESFLSTLIDLPHNNNRILPSLFSQMAPIASSGMAFYQGILYYQQQLNDFQQSIDDKLNSVLHVLGDNFVAATSAAVTQQDYADAKHHLVLIGFKEWQVEKMLSPYHYQAMVKTIADSSRALLKKNFNCDTIFEIMQYPFWKSCITTLLTEPLANDKALTSAVMLMLPLALNGITFAHAVKYYNEHYTDPTLDLKAVIRILTGMTLADYTHIIYPRKKIDVRMNAVLPTLGYSQPEINHLTSYQRQMGALNNVEHFHLQFDHVLPAWKIFEQEPSKLYRNFIAKGYDNKVITEIFFANDFSIEKLKRILAIFDELVTVYQKNTTFITTLMREKPSMMHYEQLLNSVKFSHLLRSVNVDANLCKVFFSKYATLSQVQFQQLFYVLELIKTTPNPPEKTQLLLNTLLLTERRAFSSELAAFQQTLDVNESVIAAPTLAHDRQTSLALAPEEAPSIMASPLNQGNRAGNVEAHNLTTSVSIHESLAFEPLLDIPLGRSNDNPDFMVLSPLRPIMAASSSTMHVSRTHVSPTHVSRTHVSPFLTATGQMMPSFSPISPLLPYVPLEQNTRVAKRLFSEL